jgi:HK97 family phage major capsid protein
MEIKTMADLNKWSGTVEDRLNSTWAKTYTSNGPNFEQAYADLGKLAKGIAKNDKEGTMRWTMERKANIGTPLVSDATTGSYLTTTEIADAVKWAAYQSSVLVPRVDHTNMGARQKSLPVASTMPTMSWQIAQSSAFTEVSPTFDTKSLTAYSLGGFVCVTESLLEDNDVDLGQYLANTFGSYLGYELDYQIARGTGSPWTGILPGATYSTNLPTGNTQFTDIGWDELVAMIAALNSERWQRNGVFVFHPIVVNALRSKKDANGNYILRESLSLGGPPAFLGYPVFACDALPSTNAASTKFGFFGNPKYFTMGDRVEMSVEKFDKTYAAAQYETVAFRARGRYAGVITLPQAFVAVSTPAS